MQLFRDLLRLRNAGIEGLHLPGHPVTPWCSEQRCITDILSDPHPVLLFTLSAGNCNATSETNASCDNGIGFGFNFFACIVTS